VNAGTVKTFTQRDEVMCAVLNDGAVQCWGSNARGAFAELPTRDRGYLEAPVMAHPKYLGLQQLNQPDRLAPFISIVGDSLVYLMQGTGYLDWGAVAFDDIDGRMSVTADNNVDTSVPGKYRVTYTATDAAGNARTAVRTVMVTETFVEGSGAAVTDAIVYKIDDQDAAVSVINRDGSLSYSQSYVNGSALLTYNVPNFFIGIPTMNAGSYVEYDLSLLPTLIAGYELTMNAPVNAYYCDALSYQVLNESGELVESFLVDHREAPITIGVTALNSQYKIRIDSDSSQCSDRDMAIIDELQIRLIAEFEAPQSCAASNDDGNAADVSAPNLCLQGEQTIVINEGEAFVDPGAIAIDGRDGVVNVSTTNAVDYKTPGTYTIYYSSADSAGNTVSTSRTIEVLDTTAPDIMLRGEVVMRLKEGDAFIDPGASALDNVDGYFDISATGVVDTSAAGWYPLVYSMTDAAGNTSSITRSVIVEWANGVGNAEGVTLAIDNSDSAFALHGWDAVSAQGYDDSTDAYIHAFYGLEPSNMVNKSYSPLNSRSLDAYYYEYNLNGLDEELATYEITMNTVMRMGYCQKVAYQIVDPIGNVVDTLFADHMNPETAYNQDIFIGQTVLTAGFSIRISNAASDCGPNGTLAIIDELNIRGINAEEQREPVFAGVLKIDNSDDAFSSTLESSRNLVNLDCVNAGCARFLTPNHGGHPTGLVYEPEFFSYSLDALPIKPMVYEVKMQTYSSTMNGHCTHVRYELLDENQNILKRMTVNHRQYPYVWIADELVLKRGDILRINASESEYSGACQAWLDQLEITQKFIDKFAPVITIAGEQIVEVQQGATYFDMGATLSDNLSDVDVSLDISSNVDMSLPGTYQVVYTATDMSGNVSTKTRTVEVVAPAAP
jgi:hypothetical protein